MVFCDGSTIPVYYDSQSFRSSSKEILKLGANGTRKPDYILSLRFSFTSGFGVPAKSTFCHLMADELGMVPLNAGRCSYGLAEMLILVRRLIPEFKPKIVLVQYSPWLVERSQQRYGPTFYGLLPHPYFVEESVAGLKIHGPDFMTAIFRHDFATPKVSDSIAFAKNNVRLNRRFFSRLGKEYALPKVCRVSRTCPILRIARWKSWISLRGPLSLSGVTFG